MDEAFSEASENDYSYDWKQTSGGNMRLMNEEFRPKLIIDFGTEFGEISRVDVSSLVKNPKLSPQEILDLISTIKRELEPLGFKVLNSDKNA